MRAQFGWRTMVGAVALTLIASQGGPSVRINRPRNRNCIRPSRPSKSGRRKATVLRRQELESMADHEIATWLIVRTRRKWLWLNGRQGDSR